MKRTFQLLGIIWIAAILSLDIEARQQKSQQQETLNTDLLGAVAKGDTASVKSLLSKGAGANAKNVNGLSPLMIAAARGDLTTVKMLIASGANVNDRFTNQMTVLMIAAWGVQPITNSHTTVVETLIAAGADVNATSETGVGARFIASQRNHKTVEDLLTAKGARSNPYYEDLRTNPVNVAGTYALTKMNLDTALYKSGVMGWFLAARNGDTTVIQELLKGSIDVNVKDAQGMTALMEAASNNHVATVEALLDKGANINQQNDGEYSALMLAVRGNRIATVKILLTKGADVNPNTNRVATPLMLATRRGYIEIVKLLKEAGAKE